MKNLAILEDLQIVTALQLADLDKKFIPMMRFIIIDKKFKYTKFDNCNAVHDVMLFTALRLLSGYLKGYMRKDWLVVDIEKK